MIKWFLTGLTALVLTACAYSVGFDTPYQAAVQVKAGDAPHCSGVLIGQTDTTVTVLTAGHCTMVADITALRIHTETCGIMDATSSVDHYGNGTDVALIMADKKEVCNVEVAQVADTVVVGEPVVVVGFPGVLGKTVAFGFVADDFVEAMNLRFTVFQLAGAPGNSGSGIFNSVGDIVGILTGPAAQGFGLIRGSTIDDIKALINEAV